MPLLRHQWLAREAGGAQGDGVGSGDPNGCQQRPPRFSAGIPWRAVAVTLGLATVFGLALASQIALATAGSEQPIPWRLALTSGLVDSWIWTLFVPPIFALTRRFPLGTRRWHWNAALHLAAAVFVATAYTVLEAVVVHWVVPESLQISRRPRGPRPGTLPGGGPGLHEHPPDWPRERPEEPGPGGRGIPGEPPEPGGPGDLGAPGAAVPGGRGPGAGRGWRGGPPPQPRFVDLLRFQVGMRWGTHVLTYAMIAGIWHWLAQQQRLGERERQARELSRQLAEARLQALRMQLNPHFLFNTLNAIATLVHRAPRAADEMIACLSDFLRLTLSAGSAPEAALRHELEFARRYLEIEKARFGDRLSVIEDIPPETLDGLVPTLVLQPLLENAIRHGIERCEGRGEIQLSARREATGLVLRVSDRGPGLRGEGAGGSGIGLANTRARLQELHGDLASLRLADRPGGGLEVEIRLPWRPAPG